MKTRCISKCIVTGLIAAIVISVSGCSSTCCEKQKCMDKKSMSGDKMMSSDSKMMK